MDPTRFDALARTLGGSGTRRRILAVLAALPLGGTLLALEDDEAAAERPRDRVKRRNQQHKRKQRNNKNKNNKNKNTKKKGGGLGGSQCGATDSDCSQDSDCCSNNCFNLGCADKVHSCGSGDSATACHPAANGCAGGTCCHGAAVCGGSCCDGAANQCNPQGECCAPNCAGRLCGPDGCGGGGTCGACPSGTTCDEVTGRCPRPGCDVCPTCTYTTVQSAVEDPNGPTTIRICPGTYTESIYITRSLTLIGAGQGNGPGDTILRWPDEQGVVTINDGVVTLQSLRITDATTGGVRTLATTLTMTDCTVTGNSVSETGGAGICALAGTLIMTGCTISDNHVVGEPAQGGGLFLDGENVKTTLTNCIVSGNTANGTDPTRTSGGGIYVDDDATLTLNNTRVTGNSTNGAGGGIYVEEDGSSVTLQNGSVVSGNSPDDCNGC